MNSIVSLLWFRYQIFGFSTDSFLIKRHAYAVLHRLSITAACNARCKSILDLLLRVDHKFHFFASRRCLYDNLKNGCSYRHAYDALKTFLEYVSLLYWFNDETCRCVFPNNYSKSWQSRTPIAYAKYSNNENILLYNPTRNRCLPFYTNACLSSRMNTRMNTSRRICYSTPSLPAPN